MALVIAGLLDEGFSYGGGGVILGIQMGELGPQDHRLKWYILFRMHLLSQTYSEKGPQGKKGWEPLA